VPHAEAVVDLSAITANARLLSRAAGEAALMAVVKADGYGHGAVPVARAALAGGAGMIGVATLQEAVALRAAGIDAPLLAWLWAPGEDVRAAIASGAQIGVSSQEQLQRVVGAAGSAPATPSAAAGQVAIHVKVDTGMGRNGVLPDALPALLADIADAERGGTVRMVGLMSHLACADLPDDPSTPAQIRAFTEAIGHTEQAGLNPRWRHLANTAATLTVPAAHFNLVRCGIGLYGLSPLRGDFGLTPAMTLRTRVALTKRVAAGQGVGYGLDYHTVAETTLALVPVGYGDGIPRIAGNRGEVLLAGKRRRLAGRVAMDQVVVDCGDDPVQAGDEVIVFGPGGDGEPTADDWAGYCDTINYEIVTRVAPRVTRRYVGGTGELR
jgi:alanine racemase